MGGQEDHADRADESPSEKGDIAKTACHVRDVPFMARIDGPGDDVDYRLSHDDPAKPAMKQIVRVEANLQKRDKRVVARGEDEKRHHVENGQVARTASQFRYQGFPDVHIVVQIGAVRDLTRSIQDDQDSLESRR